MPTPDAIPPLLEKRVNELNIPAWPGQACFERVIIYRIPDEESASEKTEGGLWKAPSRVDIDKDRSPRGVVVSAGLAAMDVLVSNGMQLGELVWFAPHVPFRFVVGRKNNQDIQFYFMNVGDIVLSEDILQRAVDGDLKLERRMNGQHVYNGEQRAEPTHTPDES
jgi:hypothetical protein